MTAFKGKTAIITGASAGIGEMVARKFFDQGANVVLIARRQAPLEKLASQLDAQRVATYAMNVTDYPAFSRVITEVKERWGAIDYLINNAGCINRGYVDMVEPEDLEEIVQVNLIAPIVLTRMILDVFKRQNYGMVINIASLAGRVPTEGATTYSCSKFGLRAFSFALAEELRQRHPDIKCCLVSPGPTITRFLLEEIDKVPDISLSQPVVTADVVAEKVLQTAMDSKMERTTGGTMARIITNIGYLFPRLKRAFKPIAVAKGKRTRQMLMAKRNEIMTE